MHPLFPVEVKALTADTFTDYFVHIRYIDIKFVDDMVFVLFFKAMFIT